MANRENAEIAELIADVREQVVYLRELGVESISVDLVESAALSEIAEPVVKRSEDLSVEVENNKEPYKPGSRLAGLPSLSKSNKGEVVQSGATTSSEVLFEAAPTLPE